jgi:sugar phosphate isomerase/epimerase
MNVTRRDLGKIALAALPAARLLGKPNSQWRGVQVGINAPYSFHGAANTYDEVLAAIVKLGLSATELRSQPVEQYMGVSNTLIPVVPAGPGGGRAPVNSGGQGGEKKGGGRGPLTPEQQAARKAAAEELRKWRLSADTDKIKDFRKMYEDAGVKIEIMKVDAIDTLSDEEIDYFFEMAKMLGAHALSCEIPLSHTKRLGEFGEKHKLMIGYHGHVDITSPEAFGAPRSWEAAMSYNKYNGINLDIGHFVAANNVSPIPFMMKYHDRITHVHIKDRGKNLGPAVPFGTGDTPIKEVLQTMAKEKYHFQATSEMEHQVPPGSDTMTELAKCVEYCKNALA